MTGLQKAILQALAYADIFDYPLSGSEIKRFLISQKKIDRDTVQKELTRMSADLKLIDTDKDFYFLRGRGKIVATRKKREKWSRKKMKIARKLAKWLKLIPTIKMVAVTGALAMGNSEEKDDIDLLIVTAKNRLWLTRLLTVFLVELVTRRRRPGDKEVKDKICLNMFLDENHLAVPKKEQDLFSAHEVCQLKLLWERDSCYQKFLKENQWVKRFLANGLKEIKKLRNEEIEDSKRKNYLITQSLNYLEHRARAIQLRYMAKRRTTEVVEPGRIRFHPKDARGWILKEYKERLSKLGIK